MVSMHNVKTAFNDIVVEKACETNFIFPSETSLGDGFRAFLYLLALAYFFIGLSAIIARFFQFTEHVVQQTRIVVEIDPRNNTQSVKHEKLWNYTIADITPLAFGTSFPQISLATIDAIRNIGKLNAGGLGPRTLVGSAAFDLFPIHAVRAVVPKAGEVKKISNLGVCLDSRTVLVLLAIYVALHNFGGESIFQVWTPNIITVWDTVLQFGLLLVHMPKTSVGPLYLFLWSQVWVPAEKGIVDIFSIDQGNESLVGIIGLKSVDCVWLLTLHHNDFPVDTNVGRVATRLGWVPLQPLREQVQIHLLNSYPMVDMIQKYLYPRL